MLQNAYFLAKIGADTAENERNVAKNLGERKIGKCSILAQKLKNLQLMLVQVHRSLVAKADAAQAAAEAAAAHVEAELALKASDWEFGVRG